MIWIIGEYAERIDNADELLDSFLEGFGDENTQVQLQLLTAIVKLFLKRPSDTQELVQRVLSLATQDSDNPDLRDRGYIYWRLLSADPVTAKEILPTQRVDRSQPKHLELLKLLLANQTYLISRWTSQDPPAESHFQPNMPSGPVTSDVDDLLGLGIEGLLGSAEPPVSSQPNIPAFGVQGLLGEIFAQPVAATGYVAPKQVWLPANKGKGLELSGTFLRASQAVFMDLTITNRAMQPMSGFAIQFNKNSFGLTPAEPLDVRLPVQPGHNYDVRLKLATTGPVQKMDNLLELQVTLKLYAIAALFHLTISCFHVAVKNDIDVFYFACVVPINVLFTEDGQMDKRLFLQAWKDIPAENEVQFSFPNMKRLSPDDICSILQCSNVFTVARRSVENQELLYHSLKLTNGIEVLSELKSHLNSSELTLSLKSRNTIVVDYIHQAFVTLLQQ
uniref:AP-1 complex subunit beta-1 n=1 Tax=Trichuris muris TaxID=70415 RepID=A0A5S6Q4W4_TRIMR